MAVDPHINPATGVWDDNYYANLNKGSGGGGGGYSAPDYASIAREQMKLMQEANKPVIESLQAQIPTIGAKFKQTGEYLGKQVSNLEDRYKGLLDSITGARERSVQAVQTNVSNELGRRGISAESGMFGQTINRATQPVEQAFAGDVSNLGATRQSALDTLLNQISGLPIEQTQAEQQLQQAIAQLQAGGNSSAITNALTMYQNQQAQLEAQKRRDLDLQIAQMGQKSSSGDRYITIGDGAMLFDTATGQIIENTKNFAGSSGGDNGWGD